MIKDELLPVEEELDDVAASSIPLLSVQGYASKGMETKKRIEEINKILAAYHAEVAPPQSILTSTLRKHLFRKNVRRFRMHTK